MSRRILFLESVAGIAGDMFAASFVDAGLVTAAELARVPELLGLEGVRVEITHPIKATMRATHVNVKWDNEKWKAALGVSHGHSHVRSERSSESSSSLDFSKFTSVEDNAGNIFSHGHAQGHWHMHYLELDRFLERSRLDSGAKAFAREVFRTIAVAEAEAHGMSIEDVAFHEVGAVDSIVDVAMAAVCVGTAKPDAVVATPVRLGRGTIKIQHGSHPVPPPASARLVVGMPVAELPDAITRANVELSTPTGLAILKVLSPHFRDAAPSGIVRAQGMGAGTMDLGSYPNVFRVMLIEEASEKRHGLPYESDTVVELACNVDDETAERTAWLIERLMQLGALDAWASPVTGKKGRPGVQLSVLARAGEWQRLADWILRHSATFGLRHREWSRLKLARRFEMRQTSKGEVRYKIGSTTTGEVLKEKAEFEDLRKLWEKNS